MIFLKDEWTEKNLRKMQPNIYSEKYYNDVLKLNKKYLKILNEKRIWIIMIRYYYSI